MTTAWKQNQRPQDQKVASEETAVTSRRVCWVYRHTWARCPLNSNQLIGRLPSHYGGCLQKLLGCVEALPPLTHSDPWVDLKATGLYAEIPTWCFSWASCIIKIPQLSLRQNLSNEKEKKNDKDNIHSTKMSTLQTLQCRHYKRSGLNVYFCVCDVCAIVLLRMRVSLTVTSSHWYLLWVTFKTQYELPNRKPDLGNKLGFKAGSVNGARVEFDSPPKASQFHP